jgi:hypothetical protein
VTVASGISAVPVDGVLRSAKYAIADAEHRHQHNCPTSQRCFLGADIRSTKPNDQRGEKNTKPRTPGCAAKDGPTPDQRLPRWVIVRPRFRRLPPISYAKSAKVPAAVPLATM